MKYVIYSIAAKEWFRAPGKGLTDNQDEAHRFTREEAKRELSRRYNSGCEMHPVEERETEGQREGDAK